MNKKIKCDICLRGATAIVNIKNGEVKELVELEDIGEMEEIEVKDIIY